MEDIEALVMQNYQENMLYFSNNYPALSNKLKALEILLGEGKYPQKYDLEFKEKYFDVIDLATGTFLYNTDSYKDAENRTNAINWKKDEHTIETFYRYNFDEKTVENAKKITANHTHATTAPIIDYCNKNLDSSLLMKKIYKFMFLGVGLGLDINKIAHKTDADVFLVIESDIELFRLSLFTCNYNEVFEKRVVFFAIAQNSEEFANTFLEFYDYAFIRNHYLKFSLFSAKDEIYIKTIQNNILTRPENCYSHAALLEKGARVFKKISKGYKFLSMLKKDESFFNDKPVLVLGAGPSLGANKEWLKKYHKNFIIIAPFMTLRVLYPLGIAPDIIVHIDENDDVAIRDVALYQDKENFFDNSLFIFSASVSNIFFDTFEKESIYLLEDRTKYKLNDNYLEIASVGEGVYAIGLSLTSQDIYLLGIDLAVGDDGATHSKVHASKGKVDVLQAKSITSESDIRKSVMEVKGNFRPIVNTIPLFEMSIRIMNLQTQKLKGQNQNVYNLNDGAYFNDTTPLKISEIKFDKEEIVEYGAVNTDYYFTYYGFYKQTDSDKVYDINVFIDGELVETIKADKILERVDNKFDAGKYGFEFELNKHYFNKPHLLEFKESKSNKLLTNGSITTVDINNINYKKYRFLDNISKDVDIEKLKPLHTKNVIGFFATQNNLEDEDFVKYIKNLFKNFPKVTFKIFYLDQKYLNFAKTIFADELSKIKFIQPLDIYEIAKDIEVWCESNQKAKDWLPQNGLIKKVGNILLQDAKYIYCMMFDNEVISDIKYSDDYLDENSSLSDLIPDTNQNRFLNSLTKPIDEEKIKDLYCKDAIGFLAVEENLNDRDFVEYIKELYVRFPKVTFKAFYFTDEQKKMAESIFNREIDRFEMILPRDIYDIAKNIQIYISSIHSNILNQKIFAILNQKNISILCRHYQPNLKNILLKDVDREWIENIVLNNKKLFDIKPIDLQRMNNNILNVLHSLSISRTDIDFKEIDMNMTQYENRFFTTLKHALKSTQYIINNKKYITLITSLK